VQAAVHEQNVTVCRGEREVVAYKFFISWSS
jgi:hypothetical protein